MTAPNLLVERLRAYGISQVRAEKIVKLGKADQAIELLKSQMHPYEVLDAIGMKR